MDDLLQRISDWMSARTSAVRAFYTANRVLVLGGLTVVSIVLVVWARLGFTFQVSQFFAAPAPSAATLQVQCVGNQAILTWNIPPGANSNSIQKNVNGAGWQFILEDLTLTKTTFTDTFTPTTGYRHKSSANVASNIVQCPTSTPAPVPTLTPTPTPTPIPTLTATPVPVSGNNAQFVSQTVPTTMTAGQQYPVSVVFKNTGTTTWATTGNNAGNYRIGSQNPQDNRTWGLTRFPLSSVPVAPGQTAMVNFTVTAPTTPGTYNFQWKMNQATIEWFGEQSQNMAIMVVAGTPTPTPTGTTGPMGSCTSRPACLDTTPACYIPEPAQGWCPQVSIQPQTSTNVSQLALQVQGRNVSTGGVIGTTVSVRSNQQVEVIARAINQPSGGILDHVTLLASLPPGLQYITGSTSVNGALTNADPVTGGGIDIGSLGSGQEMTVRFRVLVNGIVVPVTQSQALITVRANTQNAQSGNDLIGLLTVVINRPVGQPGAVQTGPGDAVLVALLVSAIMTLLYVSYTHTSVFRRHEVDAISSKRDPMDFRS